MVKAGEFLEHATVFENSYGTPKAPVEEALDRSKNCTSKGSTPICSKKTPALS